MNPEFYIRIVSGDRQGLSASSIRGGLSILSGLYRVGYEARRVSYEIGLKRPSRVKAGVISIGNITAGGAGKTPAAIFFARRFMEEGRRVIVLSRGYGRTTPLGEPLAVSDRKSILVSPVESGDEPYLIARKLPGVPVVVCGNRVRGAEFAIEKFGAEVIILDDGFQHIALARDEDIVVIDCTNPFGFGHLLPRGLLREPIGALKRATCFLLTRADESEHEHLAGILKIINPAARILKSRHRPRRLIGLKNQMEETCDYISGKRVLALSSIGNPRAFEKTLERLGADVADAMRFKDHHRYDSTDIRKIRSARERARAECIITTEKDGVRLNLVSPTIENVLALEVELELIDSGKEA